MDYWSGSEVPSGLFDANAQLDFPFDWSAWLADKNASYVSHEILPAAELECVSSAHSAGVITALMKVKAGASIEIGRGYSLTCRITATAAGLTLVDDRTVKLIIANR